MPAVYKLRMNIPLDTEDLSALESVMTELGGTESLEMAVQQANGLEVFARSLVGMDRKAAADALSDFTSGTTLTAQQLTFLDLVVDRLVEHGLAEARDFYDPPFTDVAPQGPQGLFTDSELKRLQDVLAAVKNSAVVGDWFQIR